MNRIQILQLLVAGDPEMAEIREKHRNTAMHLLPPKETDQYPARYPASYGARHDAQPSLRGVATDERAGDKG